MLQDIANFWIQEFGLTHESLTMPRKSKPTTNQQPSSPDASKSTSARHEQAPFTHRQGQFLAVIHLYRKLHRQGPAELDLVKYFRVTPPTVHDMIVRLEELGLITREPGVPRSARVAIPEEQIPPLEDLDGLSW